MLHHLCWLICNIDDLIFIQVGRNFLFTGSGSIFKIEFAVNCFQSGADLRGGGGGGAETPPQGFDPCRPKGSPLWYLLRNPFLADRL